VSERFEDAFAAAEPVEGWLTEAQARRLWDRARELPAGATAVEIGSFRGRSAIVLASGLADDARLVAIDPHAGTDRGPQEIAGREAEAEADNRAFRANLERAGVAPRVHHVREFSQQALDAVDGRVDLLYVDGAHRYGPARDDLRLWGERVRDGGKMLVHDSFSSIGVTLATLRVITAGRGWRYAGRTGSLAEYRREPAGIADTLRQLAQLPWFARNVVLKALIALRVLKRDWPY
jgi:predicted O-methyltransferase YrrM